MKNEEIEKKLENIEKTLQELKEASPQPYVRPYQVIVPVIVQDNYDYDDPCRNCPSNPMNNPFASGFCNCVLPYMGRRGIYC